MNYLWRYLHTSRQSEATLSCSHTISMSISQNPVYLRCKHFCATCMPRGTLTPCCYRWEGSTKTEHEKALRQPRSPRRLCSPVAVKVCHPKSESSPTTRVGLHDCVVIGKCYILLEDFSQQVRLCCLPETTVLKNQALT